MTSINVVIVNFELFPHLVTYVLLTLGRFMFEGKLLKATTKTEMCMKIALVSLLSTLNGHLPKAFADLSQV